MQYKFLLAGAAATTVVAESVEVLTNTHHTTLVITSCEDNKCHEQTVSAVHLVVTETKEGTETIFTTVCPLTESSSAPAPAPTTSEAGPETETVVHSHTKVVTTCPTEGCEEKPAVKTSATVPPAVAPPAVSTYTVPPAVAPPAESSAVVPPAVAPPAESSAVVPPAVAPPAVSTAVVPPAVAPPAVSTAVVPPAVAPPAESTATVPPAVAPPADTETVTNPSTKVITTCPPEGCHTSAATTPIQVPANQSSTYVPPAPTVDQLEGGAGRIAVGAAGFAALIAALL